MRYVPVVVAALAACTRQAPPQPAAETEQATAGVFDPDAPLPFDPGVRAGTLDNGLQYFIEPNPWPEGRVELRLVVNAGSVLEEPDQLGAAHFLEHMAFNGTERFQGMEIVGWLESTGMRFGPDVNAYTSFDETVYMLQLPTDDPAFVDTGLLILSEWADGIALDPAEVERERGVILEEWRTGQGAAGRLLDRTLPYVFYGSRYAERLPIGTEASLRTMDRDAIARFYETWYRPDLMAVVVVGDIEADRVEELVREHFADIEPTEDPVPRPRYDIPTDHPTLVLVETDPEVQYTGIQVLRKIPWSWGRDQESYRERTVEQLAQDMLNARLAELSQDPESPFLGAGVGRELQTPTRSMELLAGAAREGQALEALEAMLIEVRRARVHGFTETELERAKARARRAMETYYQERERTPSAVAAAEIVRHFLQGESMPGTTWEYQAYEEILPTIGVDDVNAYVADFLAGSEGRVVLATVPATDPPPSEEAIRQVLDEAEQAPVEPWTDDAVAGELVADVPEPGSIVDRQRLDEPGVEVWVLSNGARVIVKPTDFAEDQVGFAGWSWGGTSTAADEDYFSAAVAASVAARSGLGPFDRVALDHFLAGREVAVSPFVADYTEGVAGAAAPEDLETAMQLLHLTFTAPRFDEEALALELRDRREMLRNRTVDPNARLEDELNELIYGNHLRRRAWTVEDLERIELDEIAAFYRDRFGDTDDFTFAFVGNVDPDRLEALATTWLATLPTRPEDDSWRDVGIRDREGPLEAVVRAGLEDKARVRIQFNGDATFGREESHRLDALGDILEMRLREVLREELGGTYGVSVSTRMWQVPDSGYRLVIGFETEPARVEELTDAVYDIVRSMRAEPVPAAYVQTWVAQELRALETARKENASWLGWIVEYDQADWPLTDIPRQEDLLARDTPATIRAAARRYVDPGEAIEVVLLPATEG